MGWSYHDKFRLHSELGDAFIHVNPARSQLFIANPEVIEDVFLRRKDFPKPVHMYSELFKKSIPFPTCFLADRHIEMLEIFGRNANTVRG